MHSEEETYLLFDDASGQKKNVNQIEGKNAETSETEVEYKLYPQRWLVLFSFSTLSTINASMWITWAPLAPALKSYWSVSATAINELSEAYMSIYIFFSFPALYFLHQTNLRVGLLCAAALNFIGTGVRYVNIHSYPAVYAGSILCSLAQTLILAIPPLLSGIWFGAHERALATSLGVIANQLGSALSLGAPIFATFYETDSDGVNAIVERPFLRYMAFNFIISAVPLILIFAFVSVGPETPPSEAAAAVAKHKERGHIQSLSLDENLDVPALSTDDPAGETEVDSLSPTYMESIYLLLNNKSGVILTMVYGMTVSIFYTAATFLGQYLENINGRVDNNQDVALWSLNDSGYLGLTFVLVGLLGAYASGKYLDNTGQYKGTTIAMQFGSLVFMVVFLLLLQYKPYGHFFLFLVIGWLGIFLTAFISVGFEYGAGISYPADEAAVAGVLNVSAQIWGIILITVGGRIPVDNLVLGLNILMSVVLFIGLILLTFVTSKIKRPDH